MYSLFNISLLRKERKQKGSEIYFLNETNSSTIFNKIRFLSTYNNLYNLSTNEMNLLGISAKGIIVKTNNILIF